MCNPVVALSRIADAIAVLFVRPRVYLSGQCPIEISEIDPL